MCLHLYVDGVAGGVKSFTFETLSLSALANTGVWGIVKDSYTRMPIEGVTVSVDSFNLNVRTNKTGHFVLMGVPTPEV
jgi:hypothetical protein